MNERNRQRKRRNFSFRLFTTREIIGHVIVAMMIELVKAIIR